MKVVLLGVLLAAPGLALACGGKGEQTASTDAKSSQPVAGPQVVLAAASDASADPSSCAKKAGLVGANCSYSTGMMAQRVLEEGKPWTFTGALSPSSNTLKSKVAAPFTTGPDRAVNVVANEVVEQLVGSGASAQRVTLDGKLLEVDGVQYFVATAFRTPNA